MSVIMLAHNGLALITEKLQRQRLEELGPIISGSKPSQVTTSFAEVACQEQTHSPVKGRHETITSSLEPELPCLYESESNNTFKNSYLPKENTTGSYLTICQHDNFQQFYEFCDGVTGSLLAPPKKKRCRSLSGPPKCHTVMPSPVAEYNSKLWKPIVVIPQHNSRIETTGVSESNQWLSSLSASFKLSPVICSFENKYKDCYTNFIHPTSDGCFTNTLQTSCANTLQTSSGSPIPRPASAASVTSFSSIWQDCSSKESRVRILETRSLSCEDQISGSSSVRQVPSGDQSCSSHGNTEPCIPRCHSQPCILHHRRYGKKRRRDFHRPTLNFNKMTETAYTQTRLLKQADSWNNSPSKQKVCRPIPQVFTNGYPHDASDLNPIASSPLDTELPVSPMQHQTDAHPSEFGALSATCAARASPNFPRLLIDRDPEDDAGQFSSQTDDEDKCLHHGGCGCFYSPTKNIRTELFPLNDLDILEIESH